MGAPKYRTITAHLSEMLERLPVGTAIPAERELAEQFSVSRETVRQAVRELVVAGRLRRGGRSTVVAEPKVVQRLALGSYTEGVRQAGHEPGRSLVERGEVSADAVLAGELGLAEGDPVARLERVLLCDGEPVGLECTHLPLGRFPRLLEDFDPDTSLYAYLADQGVRFATATERIETMLASPREAELLGINPALPVLHLERVSLDPDDRPVERVRSLFRGDRFSFVTTLRA